MDKSGYGEQQLYLCEVVKDTGIPKVIDSFIAGQFFIDDCKKVYKTKTTYLRTTKVRSMDTEDFLKKRS